MANSTKISWANHTASPWFGCTEVSAGCVNCYSRQLTLQKQWSGWGDKSPRVVSKGFWKDVYQWNRKPGRHRIFTSLIDPFDPMPAGALKDGQPIKREVLLANFFKRVMECQNLDWLLLTKRPENVLPTLAAVCELCASHFMECGNLGGWLMGWMDGVAVPQNVWLGVTCENQKAADERIPKLLQIPARVRWLSCEPLLGDVELMLERGGEQCDEPIAIDWVVVGGESGSKRRDCGVEAIVNVAEQCQAADVPCWVKQDVALRPGTQGRIPDAIWSLKQLPHS